jgi:chemotaxis protein CheD
MAIVHVAPGEVACAQAGDELRTVLGSCVAITLWHAARRIGVMSHILLPTRMRPDATSRLDGRFAADAWAIMRSHLQHLGILPAQCQCRIFGGARVFPHNTVPVGLRNVAAVRELLAGSGVAISYEHVAGTGYRELRFAVKSGEIRMLHHPAAYGPLQESPK